MNMLIADSVKIKRPSTIDSLAISTYLRHYFFDCASLDDFWTNGEVRNWILNEDDYCAGAYLNDELIGFCLTHYHKETRKVHLENVFVVEKYRRNGIANKLLADAIMFYSKKTKKVRYVGLVNAENIASTKLLEKNGFAYGNSVFWMQKNDTND
ncbi:hypothetical protein FACS1894190_11310 [Spirochaetia bacterium]|nr:hypothetical protein FACS1894190_11310 [Spirochaetia bacterium]